MTHFSQSVFPKADAQLSVSIQQDFSGSPDFLFNSLAAQTFPLGKVLMVNWQFVA